MVKEFRQSSYALLRKARTAAASPTEPALSIGSDAWFLVSVPDASFFLVGWPFWSSSIFSVGLFP